MSDVPLNAPKSYSEIPQFDPILNTLTLVDGNTIGLEIIPGPASFQITFDYNGKHYDYVLHAAILAMEINTSILGVLKLVSEMDIGTIAGIIDESEQEG